MRKKHQFQDRFLKNTNLKEVEKNTNRKRRKS